MNDQEYHAKTWKEAQAKLNLTPQMAPFFERDDYEDFTPMELCNFYGFLYGLKLEKFNDLPILLEDLFQSTRTEFLKVQDKSFVDQFEKILYDKHKAIQEQIKPQEHE